MSEELVTVARGKTYPIRDLLRSYDFVWHSEDKTWRRDPPLNADELEAIRRSIRRTSVDNFDASTVEVRNIRKNFLS